MFRVYSHGKPETLVETDAEAQAIVNQWLAEDGNEHWINDPVLSDWITDYYFIDDLNAVDPNYNE